MPTITLSPEVSERVEKAAAARGQDAAAYADALMTASVEADLREFEETCASIARALVQEKAGDMVDGDTYFAERRAKREARRTAPENRAGSPGAGVPA